MEFGIFNLMGSRDPAKPTVEVFAEVAEQTGLADELGYAITWFAEHHFSNYCLCASPLMMVAHCVWPPRFYHRFDRRVARHTCRARGGLPGCAAPARTFAALRGGGSLGWAAAERGDPA
jgi:hypothetical protein